MSKIFLRDKNGYLYVNVSDMKQHCDVKKKKCQTKMSQGPSVSGFKSRRSKFSICYNMLDFYNKQMLNVN